MKVSEAKYRQIALADPHGQWELECGSLTRKPAMTFEHSRVANVLGFLLQSQLDLREYAVHVNSGRTRRTDQNYHIPDVIVIPMSITGPLRHRQDVLDAYNESLPLVEVWSPSTGRYDVDSKLPEYQRRGDLEIWRLHPFERTLIAWHRQPDGNYSEARYEGRIVRPAALPGVSIDLDELFSV